MTLDEIIERILSARRNLTREEVLKRIEDKKKEAEGYFTDEGAARMVASELGVEITHEAFQPEVLINDLVSGLNDVTVTGRVITVYPAKTFTRSDRTQGKVAHLIITDKSGSLKGVLWDEKANLIEEGYVESGQIIKVSHGYVREGFDGRLELHVGKRGEIRVSPSEASPQEYPLVASFLQKIGDVTKGVRKVSVLGVVQGSSPISTFKRRDGSQGKVRRLQLRDETGQISLVLWDDKVDELSDVDVDDCLKVVEGRVKEDFNGRIEIHTRNTTKIEVLKERPDHLKLASEGFVKIRYLKPGIREVDVLARVMHVGDVREFKRKTGETGKLCTLLLKDETGTVRLNLWDDKVALSEQIKSGDIVLVEKAYTRERFEETNLNLGKRGTLTVNPEVAEAEKLPSLDDEKITPVAEVKQVGGPVTLEGTLETAPNVREVTTSRGETVAVASFELADDTGKIRVSAWRNLVEAVVDLLPGTRIRIKNAYVRRGLSDQLELTSRMLTSIEPVSKSETQSAQETL